MTYPKSVCIVLVAVFVAIPMRSVLARAVPRTDNAVQLLKTYTDEKSYDKVCWLTSHNSFAYNSNLVSRKEFIRANQSKDIYKQLQYGVRGFTIDAPHEFYFSGEKIVVSLQILYRILKHKKYF